MKDHKNRIFLFYILFTIFFFFTPAFIGHAKTFKKYSFEVEGILWTVRTGSLESFDSAVAMDALKVSNEFGERGYSQSAWIGENPGDLGPMWIIHNRADEVLGACWIYYDAPNLECIPLYVPLTLSLD